MEGLLSRLAPAPAKKEAGPLAGMGLQSLASPMMLDDVQVKPESHFPQRMHGQEARYSPALRTLGGYSYERSEEPEESTREATAEDYRKNPFLLNLLEPENVTRETINEPETQDKQPDRPQRNSDYIEYRGTKYFRNPRDGKYYNSMGQQLR